jgi:hypothetical protein
MNEIPMVLGYLLITIVVIFCLLTCCEFFQAARWYYTRFNSNKISDIEDVIYDANLRIEQIRKENLK